MIVNKTNRLQTYLTPTKRKNLSKVWVGITIIYDIARALVIAKTFYKYKINVYYYLTFELVISILFAIASLRLVLSIVDRDRKKMFKYSLLTSLLFFAPEIYIVCFGEGIPGHMYLILGIYLLITFSISCIFIIKDAQKRRREKLLITSFEDD